MYIIKNRYFIRATILCLMLITSSIVVSAQDSIVNPLSKSEKKTIHTDMSQEVEETTISGHHIILNIQTMVIILKLEQSSVLVRIKVA